MSNPDKHKPLSPEELFKLLDNTSNSKNDFDELDDFEREALEGFSAHSDAQKAKVLTKELNIAIFKKASASDSGRTKNRIIWFSAAASIVLIIMMSVLFFNNSKQDSVNNIALNESLDVEQSAAVNSEGVVVNEPITTENKEQKIISGEITNRKLSQNEERDIAATGASAYAISENKAELAFDETSKDKSKLRNENDDKDQDKLADAFVEKMYPKSKDKGNLQQEQQNMELSVGQNISTTAALAKEETKDYKTDANQMSAGAKKAAEKETAKPVQSIASKSVSDNEPKKQDGVSGGLVTLSNSASAPSTSTSADNQISKAYFNGNDTAIRDVVVTYFKDKLITTPIIGKYKINGVVNANGKLSVNAITKISNEDCNCTDDIKKALDTMKNWNASVKDGKRVSSDVEFVLSF